MKQIIFSLLISSFLLSGFTASAQAKFGHVNSQEILLAMPETKQMNVALEQKQKQLKTELERMYTAYQKDYQELQEGAESMMESIRQAKIQGLADSEKRIQSFEVKAQEEILSLEEELTLPILEKARDAIKNVAASNGYTYVFDISSGAVLHYPDGDDITPLVKSKLGVN